MQTTSQLLAHLSCLTALDCAAKTLVPEAPVKLRLAPQGLDETSEHQANQLVSDIYERVERASVYPINDTLLFNGVWAISLEALLVCHAAVNGNLYLSTYEEISSRMGVHDLPCLYPEQLEFVGSVAVNESAPLDYELWFLDKASELSREMLLLTIRQTGYLGDVVVVEYGQPRLPLLNPDSLEEPSDPKCAKDVAYRAFETKDIY